MRLSATLANRGQAGQVKLRKEGFDPHLSRKKKKRKLEVRQNFALGRAQCVVGAGKKKKKKKKVHWASPAAPAAALLRLLDCG